MNQSTSHLKMANPQIVKEIVLYQDVENKNAGVSGQASTAT